MTGLGSLQGSGLGSLGAGPDGSLSVSLELAPLVRVRLPEPAAGPVAGIDELSRKFGHLMLLAGAAAAAWFVIVRPRLARRAPRSNPGTPPRRRRRNPGGAQTGATTRAHIRSLRTQRARQAYRKGLADARAGRPLDCSRKSSHYKAGYDRGRRSR